MIAPLLLPYPSNRIRLIEDWISGTAVGNLNWQTENSGAGAAPDIIDTPIDASHSGILRLQTGTTAAGRSGVNLAPSGTTYTILPTGGNGLQEWLIFIPTLSVLAERYSLAFGFGDIFTAEFTNGAYFYYDEATSTNWLTKTANAATRTSTDTGVAVVANSWIKLRIEHNASTNRLFYINDTLVATHTTNISTVPIAPAANLRKSAGTTSRLAYVDYWFMDHLFTTAR